MVRQLAVKLDVWRVAWMMEQIITWMAASLGHCGVASKVETWEGKLAEKLAEWLKQRTT